MSPKYDTDDLFPASIYIYDATGHYHPPIVVENLATLQSDAVISLVTEAMQARVEIRITDPLDRLVFHADRGVVLFDGKHDPMDVDRDNLKRLARIHIQRYSNHIERARRGATGFRIIECVALLEAWRAVEANRYEWSGLPARTKDEILDAISAGE